MNIEKTNDNFALEGNIQRIIDVYFSLTEVYETFTVGIHLNDQKNLS